MSDRWQLSDVQQLVKRGRAAQSAADAIIGKPRLPSRVEQVYATRGGVTADHRRSMNKLEQRYAAHLELERLAGVWLWWEFEPITLKLAHDTRYTPDFALLDPGGHLVLHETKGFWRDDARVKIKVAARLFPFFRFTAVEWQRKAQHWTFKQV